MAAKKTCLRFFLRKKQKLERKEEVYSHLNVSRTKKGNILNPTNRCQPKKIYNN